MIRAALVGLAVVAGVTIARAPGRHTAAVIQSIGQGYSEAVHAALGPTPRERFLRSIADLAPADQELLIREYDRATGDQ